MAEVNEGGNKEFSAFLKATRSVEELASGKYTVLRGSVYRSGESAFALRTSDGRLFELEVAAVDRFKVLGTGLHPEVELSIATDALRSAKAMPFKAAEADTAFKPPGSDHKLAIKDLITDPIVDHTFWAQDHKLPFKDVHKDPISDPIGTLYHDPPGGTLAETTVEGGGFDPGQGVNPAAAGMVPFVLATPHHAPEAAVNLQGASAQARGGFKPLPSDTLKEVQFDTHKEAPFDTLKEAQFDTHKEAPFDTLKETQFDTQKEVPFDTHKETTFDTLKESMHDTRKEIIETLVEGGGTIQEGGGQGTFAEGGQGPGGFPGMPGF